MESEDRIRKLEQEPYSLRIGYQGPMSWLMCFLARSVSSCWKLGMKKIKENLKLHQVWQNRWVCKFNFWRRLNIIFLFVSVTEDSGVHLSESLCDAFGGTEYYQWYCYATDFIVILEHRALFSTSWSSVCLRIINNVNNAKIKWKPISEENKQTPKH